MRSIYYKGGGKQSVRLQASTAGDAANNIDVKVHDAVNGLGSNAIKLQVGANSSQSFSIDINDMRSKALGVANGAGGGSAALSGSGVTADEIAKSANAKFVSTAGSTDGTSNTKDEYALDVSSHETVSAAITVIDHAIASVSNERAKFGANQNRLEHTINNLNTSS